MVQEVISPPTVAFTATGTAKVPISFEYSEEFIMQLSRTKTRCEAEAHEAVAEHLQRVFKAFNCYARDNGLGIEFDAVEDLETCIEGMELG